jgi:hypothetical protein
VNAIKATWKDGQIVLDGPVDWPEGLRLLVEPESTRADSAGRREDGPMSPEEIAQTLAAMEKVEPFDMTAEEAAELEAWERKVEEYTVANLDKGIEDVFR